MFDLLLAYKSIFIDDMSKILLEITCVLHAVINYTYLNTDQGYKKKVMHLKGPIFNLVTFSFFYLPREIRTSRNGPH